MNLIIRVALQYLDSGINAYIKKKKKRITRKKIVYTNKAEVVISTRNFILITAQTKSGSISLLSFARCRRAAEKELLIKPILFPQRKNVDSKKLIVQQQRLIASISLFYLLTFFKHFSLA